MGPPHSLSETVPQVAESACGYPSSNKLLSVERDPFGEEQLLQALTLLQRRLDPQSEARGSTRSANSRMVSRLMAALLRFQRVEPDSHAWALPEAVLEPAEGLVLNPALAVMTAGRWERVRDRIWGAPNVIAEIIDKRRARRTRTLRVRWYRDFGVQECWLVDARVQRVEVLDLERRRLPTSTAWTPSSRRACSEDSRCLLPTSFRTSARQGRSDGSPLRPSRN